MWRRIGNLATAGWLLLAASTAAGESQMSRMELTVGSTRELTRPTSSDVQVSRRGVVDVTIVNDERLRVAALRPGLVVLTYVAVDGVALNKILVQVHPQPEVGARSSLPASLCGLSGLQCLHQEGLIRGVIASWTTLQRLGRLCQQLQSTCRLDIELSSEILERLRAEVTAALPQRLVVAKMSPRALVLLTACGQRDVESTAARLDALFDGLHAAGVLQLICKDEWDPTPGYLVRARIMAVEMNSTQEWGIQPLLRSPTPAPLASTFQTILLWQPRAKSAQRKTQILGEPMLAAREGYEVEVLSGGEFKVSVPTNGTDETRSMWKGYGVSFKLKVDRLNHQQIKLKTQMQASDRLNGESEALQVNNLSSELITCLDCVKLVGTLDVKSDMTAAAGLPWLSQLPILGAWLRRNDIAVTRSRLYVWAHISEDRGQDPLATSISWPEMDSKTAF